MMMPTKRKRVSRQDARQDEDDDNLDLKVKSSKKKATSKENPKGNDAKAEDAALSANKEGKYLGGDSEEEKGKRLAIAATAAEDEDSKDDDQENGEFNTKRSTFPERLMELLSNEVAKDAMWWLPSGDSFAIQPKEFSESILNKYFQGTKLESFTRKMNRWGFKRVAGQRVPPNTVAYYHNLFRKDQPDLLKGMNGGKKKDHDYRDAVVRRELNRDLGLLSAAQPMGSYASGGMASLLSNSSGLMSSLVDTESDVLLRQQQLRARVEQDLAVQQAISILNQQQQQQAAQQALAQLTNGQLAYQGFGLGGAGHSMGSPLSLVSMLGRSPRDFLGLQGAERMLGLQEESLRRDEQHSLIEQMMLLEQRQRVQRRLHQEEKDQQGRTGGLDPRNYPNDNFP